VIGGRPLVTMRKALADSNLLGRALEGDSWRAWRILLIALMGEPLDDAERVTFERLTGRATEARRDLAAKRAQQVRAVCRTFAPDQFVSGRLTRR
jgi:hypothetical protein